jgi:hypothetical protein
MSLAMSLLDANHCHLAKDRASERSPCRDLWRLHSDTGKLLPYFTVELWPLTPTLRTAKVAHPHVFKIREAHGEVYRYAFVEVI